MSSHRVALKSWPRRHRALASLLAVALVLVTVLAGWLFYLNRQLQGIERFPLELDRPDRPAKVEGKGVNILLLGLDDPDSRDEVGPDMKDLVDNGWDKGAFRSDAMMVLHVAADGQSAQLVSIPRDSWVDIPGHGKNKINAALSFGGPSLAAETVEDTFDTYLDHVVLIDFQGFRELTDILDGVPVHISREASQQLSGGEWEVGRRELNGEEALRYVRQRHGLERGDFDRVQRQQAFLKAVLDKTVSKGTLLNPVRLTNLLEEVADLVAVSEGLSNGEIRDLANHIRGLRSSDIRFVTVPNNGTGRAGAASIVELDLPRAVEMFDAIQRDRFEVWYANNEVDEMKPGGKVD